MTASRSKGSNVPKAQLEAAKRRRAVFLFSAFAAVIVLLVLWGWGRESMREARNEAYGASGEEADAAALLEELPHTPPREEVGRVLRRLSPLIATCSKGTGGVMRVHLTIQGKTGAVTEATVAKQFSGTEESRCAANIVLAAQFPRFTKKNLTVVFPYTLPGSTGDGGASSDGSISDEPR